MHEPVIFGTHDAKTLAQLRDVATRADRVALMADGHPGYVMPIGGVAAYRNQVSVVGVGFDIACFSGDTRVFTLDGRTPTLRELSERGRAVWVLSSEPSGRVRPSRATCQRTRTRSEMMAVTLDNGSEIRCTPDHPFLLRDGTYRRADHLAPGDRLMPLYRCKHRDGYVLVRNNASGTLVRLAAATTRRGVKDHRASYRRNGRRGRQYPMRDNPAPAARHLLRDRANTALPCPLCSAVTTSAPSSLWHHARRHHPAALSRGTELLRGKRRITTAQRLIAGANNHTVTQVRLLPRREDTYCLSVPNLNNFALAAGVFVHNCGNAAIRTSKHVSTYRRADLESLADEIRSAISFGMGRTNRADDAPIDHPLFADPAWDAVPGRHERDSLRAKARHQLGTVGSGNHYVDVFADEQGAIWVGVHFGSRGLGHTIASGALALAQGKRWGERVPEVEALLSLDRPLGHDYWALMRLAGEYAYAGREWVARKVVAILGGEELELVHNHHNFAWRETHDGTEYVVVRKGATPAFPGQRGFVGGSMGDNAVIVEGARVDSPRQRAALYSTVHGAGRVMSRTEARGKVNRKTGAVLRPGKVTWDMLRAWVGRKGVILRGGGLDESPQAYRRLPEVLAAQGETVTVLHTLTPLIVVMAGENELDPYRD